jgi:hypothetical protein
MGYRVHWAKKYIVEYEGGYFSWQSYEFNQMVMDEELSCWIAEDGDNSELEPEAVKDYIKKLRKLKPEADHKYLSENTNKEVADILQEMLNSYDKENGYIKIDWF